MALTDRPENSEYAMSIKETIRQINRWDYRGFGWQEIFLIGAGVFLPGGIAIGFALAVML